MLEETKKIYIGINLILIVIIFICYIYLIYIYFFLKRKSIGLIEYMSLPLNAKLIFSQKIFSKISFLFE